MAFDYQSAKNKGATDDQILEYLTKTRSYDVQGALSSGADKSQIINYLSKTGNQSMTVEQPKRDMLAPTFPATGQETPLQAGLKTAGNLPTSALRFGKNVAEMALNPIDTVKGVAQATSGALQQSVLGYGNALTGQNKRIDNQATQTFDNLVGSLKERYGSLDALQKTAVNDPFGFGTDILGLVTGGAGLAGKTGTLAKGIGATGKLATTPIKAGVGKVAEGVGETAKFSMSQLTGLNKETISSIIKDPGALKKANPELRVQTAEAVGNALDSRLEELSGLGKGYETIRNEAIPVTIPKNVVPTVLSKYGVKLDDQGKIITTPESRPLSPTDRTALQDFIDNYGSQTNLTSNSFLNVREALSNLSKFEQGKTNLPQQIARDLRGEYDAIGKSQIKGLRELDTAYAPERQLLSQLKKDIFDSKTGDLKDGAISKIANITGKGKENLLERVKQVVPDIEQRVNLIKTVEDIERASGFKTGTYIRGAITGGGALTGNIPLIVSSILSQPQIAVPLLKGFGYTGQKARPILEAIKDIANDVNNFKIPAPLINKDGQLKAGMSIEDVSKANPLIQEARKYKSAEELNIYKDSILQSPTLSQAEISTVKNAKTFDDVWGVVKTKGVDTQGMFLTRVENITKNLPKTQSTLSKTEFIDKTKGQFNSIREVGGYKIRARMYDNSPWQIVEDVAEIGDGESFRIAKSIKEFKTRDELWKYIKDNPKSQLTDIWKKANPSAKNR